MLILKVCLARYGFEYEARLLSSFKMAASEISLRKIRRHFLNN